MKSSGTRDCNLEKARAEVYAFFSRLFLNKPTPEMLAGILNEQVASLIKALFPYSEAAAAFRGLVEDYSRGVWQAESFLLDYEAMFHVPGGAYIHPFESVYRNYNFASGKARHPIICGSCTQGAARVYEAEGLGLKEGFTELPDHLGVELEFMAFLCRKAAEAIEAGDQDEAAAFRSKQSVFLGKHLLPWIRECLRKMEENASTPLYQCVAGLLRSFLEEEKLYWSYLETTDGPVCKSSG
ncbi:MAG TPA: molecular chaperone TorD family protein [Acidobacteriota bacterium]|nr:molecular chaperone TorD family protein [Acidobacteriota bacterium]